MSEIKTNSRVSVRDVSMPMKKALFIHRSVGEHLLKYGGLRTLVNAHDVSLDDYNNNNGWLTSNDGRRTAGTVKMPGDNTNPENLADFFDGWPRLLDAYDCIMIKSCYPNSRIKDVAHLKRVKACYESIVRSFDGRKQHLFILTTPPLRPGSTTATEARLAGELADWLMASARDTVRVFDLHHLYAEAAGKHKGMLKAEYRRWLPWDNHPNGKAHRVAAPQIAELLGGVKAAAPTG